MYKFNNKKITVKVKNGKNWYLAKDICNLLEYTNIKMAVSTHCEDSGVNKLYYLTSGGNQKMLFVDSHNFWRLILSAKTETAREIKEFIIDKILPNIITVCEKEE